MYTLISLGPVCERVVVDHWGQGVEAEFVDQDQIFQRLEVVVEVLEYHK